MKAKLFQLYAALLLVGQTLPSVAQSRYEHCSVWHEGILFQVDPRIEFLQTLMLLVGNPNVNNQAMPYKLAILDHFEDFQAHPLLDSFRMAAQQQFRSLDAPLFFIVTIDQDWQPRKDLVPRKTAKQAPEMPAPEEDANSAALLQLMARLEREMDYPAFFNSQVPFYRDALNLLVANLPDFDEKRRLLEYYRVGNGDEHLFIATLNPLGFGNFGPRLATTKGMEYHAILAPSSSAGRIPAFDPNELHYLIWHEFSHGFVNPVIDEQREAFASSAALLEPIRGAMHAQAYGDWHVVVQEHLVRAVTCRLAGQKFGRPFAHWNFETTELGKKYLYLPEMLAALKHYEQDPGMRLPELATALAEQLKTIEKDTIDARLARVERIRQPDVDELPQIGQASHQVLLVVPELREKQQKPFAPWPGQAMSRVSGEWFQFMVPRSGAVNLLFHDHAGTQTPDLTHIGGPAWYDGIHERWLTPEERPDQPAGWSAADSFPVFFRAPGAWLSPMIHCWDAPGGSFEAFIRQYQQQHYPQGRLVEESALDSLDLHNSDIILFGTLTNSPMLQQLSRQLPIRPSPEGSWIGDQVYRGRDLVLITAWLHPSNPDRMLEAYIARDMDDLIHIDWVPRGGTNYHLTRGLITLRSGNYTRRMNIWRM